MFKKAHNNHDTSVQQKSMITRDLKQDYSAKDLTMTISKEHWATSSTSVIFCTFSASAMPQSKPLNSSLLRVLNLLIIKSLTPRRNAIFHCLAKIITCSR